MLHRLGGAPLDFGALREQLDVPGAFPAEVLAAATASAASPPALRDGYVDATALDLVTVDPPGSRDLDQAVNVVRSGSGYTVSYAIADVAHWVADGSVVDLEARRRGQTLYFPDERIPLHPPALSEAVASLLPDQLCPAALWQIELTADGEPSQVSVRRALVRSRQRYSYEQVQRFLDEDRLPAPLAALAHVGAALRARSRARHSIELNLPEQLVVPAGADAGGWTLQLRRPWLAETFNAEISLLTGRCAAQLMLTAGVGILRTLPPPDPRSVDALRAAARALGVPWPDGAQPGDVLATLDPQQPKHAALIDHATSLLRGAGYTAFDGAAPEQQLHSGIAAPYAHVTAPLRRLVDRFGTEICLAVAAGERPPAWARAALPELPDLMRAADRVAHSVDRAAVDMTEAWLLRDRIGAQFDAVVIDADPAAATVVIDEPAIRARCAGTDLPVGERIRARLITADVQRREVRFEAVT